MSDSSKWDQKMTRLELIAQICKRLDREREENNRLEQKELNLDDLTFEPHIIKIERD
jgi:hypothetical protein